MRLRKSQATVTGSTVNSLATAKFFMRMERPILAISGIATGTAMACTHFLMGICMRGAGPRAIGLGRGLCIYRAALFMRAIGSILRKMGLEKSPMPMGMFILENSRRTKSAVRVNWN